MNQEEVNNIESIEIYPRVFVYKNVFKDVEKNYQILKESTENNDDRLFGYWSTWSRFGEYIKDCLSEKYRQQIIDNTKLAEHWSLLKYKNIDSLKCKTKIQEDQKNFLLELIGGFHLVTQDYAKKHGIDINDDIKVLDDDGNLTAQWKMEGPSIVKYKNDFKESLAMHYHSDYVWEPIFSPGDKFAITALAYFNDDYEGGEIDFAVGDDLYKYKPEAGDYLVFPSGHPDVLTANGKVYLHGVFPAKGPNKYLSRMYWRMYTKGSKEWYEKEKEFGKDVWASMQPEIMENFRLENLKKNQTLGKNRIK